MRVDWAVTVPVWNVCKKQWCDWGDWTVTVPVWNGNKKQWCAANPRGRTASALAKTDRDERKDWTPHSVQAAISGPPSFHASSQSLEWRSGWAVTNDHVNPFNPTVCFLFFYGVGHRKEPFITECMRVCVRVCARARSRACARVCVVVWGEGLSFMGFFLLFLCVCFCVCCFCFLFVCLLALIFVFCFIARVSRDRCFCCSAVNCNYLSTCYRRNPARISESYLAMFANIVGPFSEALWQNLKTE